MKKLGLLIVGIILISSMLWVGCDRGSGPRSNDPYYPIDISVLVDSTTARPGPNNKMYKWIQDKFNVTFSWDIMVGDTTQRTGTMIAANDYPDLLGVNDQFIDAGSLIALDDLIEQYGPNLKKHYADVWDKMKSPDGKVYYLVVHGVIHGIEHNPFYNGSAFWVQKAVLKDAGYPKITTVDQFFNMIADYARKNPTVDGRPVIPFTVLTDDWRAFELWNPPNFLAGNPNEGNGIVNPATLEYRNFFTDDISKRWFRLLNEYDKQGLVDRTGFTDNHDQYLAKIATGRVLGLFGQQWQFGQAEDSKTDRGEHIKTMAPLPIVFDNSIKPKYRTEGIPNLNRGLGISVSAKDPVRIIRFLDEYIKEENQRVIQWGIEGEDWQFDAQGVPYRTEQQRANWDSQSWQDANQARMWHDFAPKLEGSFSDGYPNNLNDFYPEREAMLRPEDRELFDAYGVGGYAQMMAPAPEKNSLWFPTWSMPAPPDGSPAQIALQRCEQTMKQRLPQIVLAPTSQFETLWEEYVREMTVTNNIKLYDEYMTEQVKIRVREWSR